MPFSFVSGLILSDLSSAVVAEANQEFEMDNSRQAALLKSLRLALRYLTEAFEILRLEHSGTLLRQKAEAVQQHIQDMTGYIQMVEDIQ